MKLKKDYTFDIRKDITGPCATVFDEDRIGVWQMDVDGEVGQVKIEMTLAQAECLANDLTHLLTLHKPLPEVVCGHYDDAGNFVEDTNEDNQQA